MSGGNRPGVAGGWELVQPVRNPWGKVPMTAGGSSLPSRAQKYVARLAAQGQSKDTRSRRHHSVPKSYLKQWSFEGKRVWSLDTICGERRLLGLSDVCVEEDFYRVVGPDGAAHNRVELLFGVVDIELRRVQVLLDSLDDPDALEFDDLIGLGVSIAVQRMRISQQRRLQLQHNAWLTAQNPDAFKSFDDPSASYLVAGIHTKLLFEAMWEAADVLTTRQIEVWHDPHGVF